jgi:hypothetical protein
MIASPDAAAPTTAHDHEHHQADTYAARMQAWAHELVLQIIESNLPLTELSRLSQIPFQTLREYVSTPEVQTEIDAYEELVALRARLVGQTARPISIRRMLDVLETPTPRPLGRDPESDQRALHRHAELIMRTAAAIARESRALAPKPTTARTKTRPQPNPAKAAPERTNPNDPVPGNTGPGSTALQSGVDAASTISHPSADQNTKPHITTPNIISQDDTILDDATRGDTAPDGSALGGSASGGTALQSAVNHPDTSSHQSTEQSINDASLPNTDHDIDDSALDQDALGPSAHRASSLVTTAGSTRARDHPCA